MVNIQKACEDCKYLFSEEYIYCPCCGKKLSILKLHNFIYNKLKDYRSNKSKEAKLPPYTIFKNDTLTELATILPESLGELNHIKGMGGKRLEKYGQEIIEIIKENKDKEDYVKSEILDKETGGLPSKEYTPINIFTQLKTKYPEHLIFIQSGYFYELFGEDAKECNRLFGWKLVERCDLDWTGVPCKAFKFKDELKSLNKPYIIVEQVVEDGYLKREIVERYPSELH